MTENSTEGDTSQGSSLDAQPLQGFAGEPKWEPEPLWILFDGPPGPEAGRFVEVENEQGASVRAGEWTAEEWTKVAVRRMRAAGGGLSEAEVRQRYPQYWRLGPLVDGRVLAELVRLRERENLAMGRLASLGADIAAATGYCGAEDGDALVDHVRSREALVGKLVEALKVEHTGRATAKWHREGCESCALLAEAKEAR